MMNAANRLNPPVRTSLSMIAGALVCLACTIALTATWSVPTESAPSILTAESLGSAAAIGGKGQGAGDVQTPSQIVADEGTPNDVIRFEASGKVRIELHDPADNVVSRDRNEIDGAVFEEGDKAMSIEIPRRIFGDYKLYLYVDGSANRVHTFNVWVTDEETTIPLAESVLIMNAPRDPYVIRISQDGFANVTGASASTSNAATPGTDKEDEEDSSALVWVLVVGGVVLLGAGAALLVVRFRKPKQ